MCNALVCLAVWLCLSARGVVDKILAIVFPITAFVASGFEHSIANMYFIPLGILLKEEPEVLKAAGKTAADLANLNWQGFLVETFFR
jgi:formate/nitrite transporter FocA (FNT family)